MLTEELKEKLEKIRRKAEEQEKENKELVSQLALPTNPSYCLTS